MSENQLIIMRHAKSDWSEAGKADFDRPLTDRGKKAAKNIGNWLKQKQYRIDRIICSAAVRAKQTCQLVVDALDIPETDVHLESAIYEASRNDLIALIKQYSKGVQSLLIIES